MTGVSQGWTRELLWEMARAAFELQEPLLAGCAGQFRVLLGLDGA